MHKIRFALFLVLMFAALRCLAGNIVVVSPTDGQYIGSSTDINFNITNAITAVTVSATLTGPNNVSVHVENVFSTISDGKINDKLVLALDKSLPEGQYSLQVTADDAAHSFNTPAAISVNVILTAPKMLDFSPTDKSFVRGVVPITVAVKTSAIKDYKVQVDSQDIPNNTGSTTSFTVNWDTANITTDGNHTITITVRDKALNTLTQTISVTLDRIAPVVQITFPSSTTRILPHTDLTVLIDIADSSTSSVAVQGVTVLVKDTAGTTLFRVPRISFTGTRWTGRIRSKVNLPNKFVLSVDCVDKAGNKATSQTATFTVG